MSYAKSSCRHYEQGAGNIPLWHCTIAIIYVAKLKDGREWQVRLLHIDLVIDVVHSIAWRRMLTIRNDHTVGVVRLALAPNLSDCRQYRAASARRDDVDVRRRVRGALELGVEWSGEGAVLEDGLAGAGHGFIRADDVAGLFGDEREHVGSDVPSP